MTTDLSSQPSDEQWAERRARWPRDELEVTNALVRDAATRYPEHDSVRRAAESVRLAVALGDELRTVRATFPDTPEVPGILGALRQALDLIRLATISVPGDDVPSEATSVQLDSGAGMLSRAALDFVEALRAAGVHELQQEDQERASRLIDLFAERLRARQLVSETEGARDEARRAAGATGESALAAHFSRYAARERRAANVLRALSIVALLAITAIAAALLFESTPHASTPAVLAKLSVTLPLAVLASYLAREAGRHREGAEWAAELEVQLMTVDAYTTPLSASLRDDIRADLGRRVFAAAATSIQHAEPDRGALATSVADATGLVERATQLLKDAQSHGDASR